MQYCLLKFSITKLSDFIIEKEQILEKNCFWPGFARALSNLRVVSFFLLWTLKFAKSWIHVMNLFLNEMRILFYCWKRTNSWKKLFFWPGFARALSNLRVVSLFVCCPPICQLGANQNFCVGWPSFR